jgi:hypothetical protein
MKVTKRHLEAEMKYLESVLAVIDRQGSVADKAMHAGLKEAVEFKQYRWERGREMDLAELAENRRSVNLEMRKVSRNTDFWPSFRRPGRARFLAAWISRMSWATGRGYTSG